MVIIYLNYNHNNNNNKDISEIIVLKVSNISINKESNNFSHRKYKRKLKDIQYSERLIWTLELLWNQ